MECEVPLAESNFANYVNKWLDKYSFIKITLWEEPALIMGFIKNNKEFEILLEQEYFTFKYKTFYYYLHILHELIHVALVRKDELFLPNIGMKTKWNNPETEMDTQYYTTELSIMVYANNIIKLYPSFNSQDFHHFPERTVHWLHTDFDAPQIWQGVRRHNVMEKLGHIFTVQDFEAKLTDNLDYLRMNI